MKKHFRIVVVDDNELIRHGLCRMLESEKDMRVVGDFASADDVIQQVGTLSPDVVLMDAEMPGKNGIEATHHLKNNGLNCQAEVIILAECADYLIGALAAGAAGYIYKNVNGGELVQMVREVCHNKYHQVVEDTDFLDQVELIVPEAADATQLRRFAVQVENMLQANILETVGSRNAGTAITVLFEHTPIDGILDRLRDIPDLEEVEELHSRTGGLASLAKRFKTLFNSKAIPRKRLLVTLKNDHIASCDLATALN